MLKLPGFISTTVLEFPGLHLFFSWAAYLGSNEGSVSVSPLPVRDYGTVSNSCGVSSGHQNIFQVKTLIFCSIDSFFLLRKLPDRTARSFTLKPVAANCCFRTVMLAKGDGRLNKASLAIDALPSPRPVGTSQYGPSIWKERLWLCTYAYGAVYQWR